MYLTLTLDSEVIEVIWNLCCDRLQTISNRFAIIAAHQRLAGPFKSHTPILKVLIAIIKKDYRCFLRINTYKACGS